MCNFYSFFAPCSLSLQIFILTNAWLHLRKVLRPSHLVQLLRRELPGNRALLPLCLQHHNLLLELLLSPCILEPFRDFLDVGVLQQH